MTKNEDGIYYVSGPKGCCIVWGREAIEPAIQMLAEVYGDDTEDYTATRIEDISFGLHRDAIAQG